jgi:hypothetical protein
MRPHSDDFKADDFKADDFKADDFKADDFEDSDTREIERREPSSFSHRHGLKVLGGILATMFATVIVAQVAC